MNRFILVILFAFVVAGVVPAQEKVTLTTPQTVSITDFEIMRVDMQRLPSWGLRIYYRDTTNSKEFVDEHSEADAETLVKALNKANLNPAAGGKTLERRALEHLQSAAAHGGVAKIGPGSVTGSPQ